MSAQYHIVSISSEIIEDSFKDGLLGSSGCGLEDYQVGKTFDSVDEMLAYLEDYQNLTSDRSNYVRSQAKEHQHVFSSSRMCVDHSNAQNGGWFSPTDEEIASWKKGKVKLYSEDFSIRVLVIGDESKSDLSGWGHVSLLEKKNKVSAPVEQKVSVNSEQRLFVISSGDGYSCFGFDNCYRDAKEYARRLKKPDVIKESEIGTMAQYHQRDALLNEAHAAGLMNDTWFTPGTPEFVQTFLEQCRQDGRMVRLVYGDKDSGEAWGDDPLSGRIGRSSGMQKVPLLVKRGASGGEAILTDCIVRIEDSKTNGCFYEHPNFHYKDQVSPSLG